MGYVSDYKNPYNQSDNTAYGYMFQIRSGDKVNPDRYRNENKCGTEIRLHHYRQNKYQRNQAKRYEPAFQRFHLPSLALEPTCKINHHSEFCYFRRLYGV